MELKKVQKQGRDERTQEDYRTSAVYFCRCTVVFLRSFISALFLYFFLAPSLLEIKFYRNCFPYEDLSPTMESALMTGNPLILMFRGLPVIDTDSMVGERSS